MKKILVSLAWIIAIIGTLIIGLIAFVLDNYILFYVGIGAFVLGAIGAWVTGRKTKDEILNLFNLI